MKLYRTIKQIDKEMAPLHFCIVTPNLNMGEYLAETIESILMNIGPGDEYIIVDGCSNDNSMEVIQHYSRHLTDWISEKDCGYADAISKGFERSQNELMCWINSGDLLLRGALDAAREALNFTSADLIFGDDLLIDEKSKVLNHSSGRVKSLKHMMLYGGWTPLQDACYWRRSLYERISGIKSQLKYAADYDFFLRASCSGVCVYIPYIYSAFRLHEGQKSVAGSRYYETERQACRKQMIRELNIDIPARSFWSLVYWFIVRWRHHVTRRFHSSMVTRGTLATAIRSLPVM